MKSPGPPGPHRPSSPSSRRENSGPTVPFRGIVIFRGGRQSTSMARTPRTPRRRRNRFPCHSVSCMQPIHSRSGCGAESSVACRGAGGFNPETSGFTPQQFAGRFTKSSVQGIPRRGGRYLRSPEGKTTGTDLLPATRQILHPKPSDHEKTLTPRDPLNLAVHDGSGLRRACHRVQ